MKAAREAWFEQFAHVPVNKLVFIDEFGASTNMTRTHGRAPRGKRVGANAPARSGGGDGQSRAAQIAEGDRTD